MSTRAVELLQLRPCNFCLLDSITFHHPIHRPAREPVSLEASLSCQCAQLPFCEHVFRVEGER